MEGNYKLILVLKNIKTTIIARDKDTKNKDTKDKVKDTRDDISTILDILGVEKVPYNELVPKQKQIRNDDDLINQHCSICHDNYKLREYKRELDCSHVFHKRCIDKWLKNNLSCPICRQDIGNLMNF